MIGQLDSVTPLPRLFPQNLQISFVEAEESTIHAIFCRLFVFDHCCLATSPLPYDEIALGSRVAMKSPYLITVGVIFTPGN